MIRQSAIQLPIDTFLDPAIGKLNPTNRWIVLADQIPWTSLCAIYESRMNGKLGAPSKGARLVIGALVVKHKLKLSDRETIEQIKENPYLQYFVGLSQFVTQKAFDPSLFVSIRKRLYTEDFNQMSHHLQEQEILIDEQGKGSKDSAPSRVDATEAEEEQKQVNSLVVDATVAPQDIAYPTDHCLVATSRRQSELIIDALWKEVSDKSKGKPRSYREKAHKEFVQANKKRKKGQVFWREATENQLRYLERNLKYIDRLLDKLPVQIPLSHKLLLRLFVIREIARQQREMINSNTNQIENRIVNVFQPYVRPIKRGKASSETEFGAKISLSLHKGYSYIDHIDWDNYYEGKDELVLRHIEQFRRRNPEVKLDHLTGDKVYGNRGARLTMENEEVDFIGTSLGRKPKDPDKIAEREKNKVLHQQLRSQVEGKFGEAKRSLGLDKIKARRSDTSLTWIACIIFVANLNKFWKRIYFDLFYMLYMHGIWDETEEVFFPDSNFDEL